MEKATNVNLSLWNRRKTTDPRYTSEMKIGGEVLTSVDAQWLIEQATEEWGPYGISWGLRDIEKQVIRGPLPGLGDKSSPPDVPLVYVGTAKFYYPHAGTGKIANGEYLPDEVTFEIGADVPVYVYRKSMQTYVLNDDAIKKLETTMLKKALSKLGFSADAYLGMFEDEGYSSVASDAIMQKDPERVGLMEEFEALYNKAMELNKVKYNENDKASKLHKISFLPKDRMVSYIEVLKDAIRVMEDEAKSTKSTKAKEGPASPKPKEAKEDKPAAPSPIPPKKGGKA